VRKQRGLSPKATRLGESLPKEPCRAHSTRTPAEREGAAGPGGCRRV